MAETRYDVLGVGNAIVDVIARCEEAFLDQNAMIKGTMRLIDAQQAQRLYELMGPATELSGGSAANTCAGLASLGARAAFIGKVANDQLGEIFSHDIRSIGVAFASHTNGANAPTARSLILVTPDGQRTMNTFLGASTQLSETDIEPELIGSASMIYLEGYLFDAPEARAAFVKASRIAAAAGRMVALSLSDTFCVERHRAAFRSFIAGGVNLVFGNANEVLALYETDDLDEAIAQLRSDCDLAAVTRSEKGSLIVTPDDVIEVAPAPVTRVIDTTGAGDLYCAGFLYGLARQMPLAECGRIASIAAAEVITHVGARPQTSLAELVRDDAKSL
jgi:sugar/nucleoside kinase (ribokinase family)